MNIQEIKKIIEGLLFASSEPLNVEDIVKVFAMSDRKFENKELKQIIEDLAKDYSVHGIELKEVASGYRFQVRQDLADWVSKLWVEKPQRYSRALLETLAIIAYKQPATRAEIEEIRGVAVGTNIIKTLLEHEWTKIVGYKEVPGKPALFATTAKFLDHFNLKSLEELPALPELLDLDQVGEQLQLELQVENDSVSKDSEQGEEDDKIVE